jgi:hypothetical protein
VGTLAKADLEAAGLKVSPPSDSETTSAVFFAPKMLAGLRQQMGLAAPEPGEKKSAASKG